MFRAVIFNGRNFQKLELWSKNCEHEKCRGMMGLQFFYKHLSLILAGSRRKTGWNRSCQAVSEMGWNLLIFNSIIHSKILQNLKFYQLQSSSKNQGLQLFCFEFGSIPHIFQTIGFWTLGNFWHFWKFSLLWFGLISFDFFFKLFHMTSKYVKNKLV